MTSRRVAPFDQERPNGGERATRIGVLLPGERDPGLDRVVEEGGAWNTARNRAAAPLQNPVDLDEGD